MADKTAAAKMGMKPGMKVALLHAPDAIEGVLGLPEGVSQGSDPAEAEFILAFASTQAEAEERVTALAPFVTDKTVAWLAYPKGSKAAGRDISRDTIFGFVPTVGLQLVSNISIDDKWSSLRMRPAKQEASS